MTEEWDRSWVTPLSAIWSNVDQMQWSYSVRRAALFLKKHASERRLRLFAVAVCRKLGLGANNRVPRAIEVAEQFADDASLDDRRVRQRRAFENQVEAARRHHHLDRSNSKIQLALAMDALLSVSVNDNLESFLEAAIGLQRGEQVLFHSLQEAFGNPFRPVTFSPGWRTSTAVAIAQSMYESRDFAPMPLLADALQDAGCEISEIIDHCHGPGPHVRGCWVVDGVLGKA